MAEKVLARPSVFSMMRSRGLVSVLDQAVISGVNFVTTVFIGRWMGASDLGIYILIFTVLTFLIAAAESLIAAPMTSLIHKYADAHRRAYLGSVLIHHALLVAVVFASAVLATAYAYFNVPGLTLPLAAAALWLPAVLTRELARRYAMATFKPNLALGLDLAIAALHIGWLGLLAITRLTSLFAILLGAFVAQIVGIWAWWRRAAPALSLEPAAWREHLGSHLRLGSGNLLALGTFIAQLYIAPWLLAVLATPSFVGQFAACHTLVMLTNPLTQGLANAVMPQAALLSSEGKTRELRRYTGTTAVRLSLIVLPLAIPLILVGGPLLALLYGDGFGGLQGVITALAVAALVRSAAMAAYVAVWAVHRSIWNAAANVAGLLATIGATVALFEPLGLVGAAIALLVGDTLAALVRTAAFWHVTRN
ncbi:lipopolysaccharide biosynthesis protein [Pelagibacterium xiamenense]|uniref:lipopolysaccharide biosynthesis protein n=1 Tax=Pelagibacterium xiamenense TaxID=2901140 RepID=UPI001E63BC8B|nr:lipopolysaccharide biosynthesis protein [Pelagibacterium xiamenense]MCD7058916.1 lipopolysaccharide biosynthesis protein [Pelagibacterium xiamenense]